MQLPQLVALYLAWCADHRAASTVRSYRGRLQPLATRFSEREFADLKPLEIEAWLAAEGRFPDGRTKAPDTRRLTAAVFEAFQTWAVQRRELAGPIIAKIEKPQQRERDRIPTEAETAALLSRATPEFRRIYQALRLCGARPNELCRATFANYDPAAGVIELKEHKTAAKTGRPRRIAVGQQLAAVIAEATAGRTEGPLFLAPTGKPWSPGKLSQAYRTLRDKAGLPRDLVLYCARHEHGTIVAREQGLHVASRSLGHSNIKTTMRYAHTSAEELRAAQDVIPFPPPAPPVEQPPDISRENSPPPTAEPPAAAA